MKKAIHLLSGAAGAMVLASGIAWAQQLSVDINPVADAIRIVGIPSGKHGFHVHEKGDCGTAMKNGKAEAGGAAGSHYDPDGKKTHKGPQGAGHKGDLPVLTANAKGIDQSVTAPKLKLADVQGRALVIHEGGDNYSDKPENGGGNARIACGVIPKG